MKMAANNAVLNRLEQKGAEADQVIEYLKQQIALLKEKASKEFSLVINLLTRWLKLNAHRKELQNMNNFISAVSLSSPPR